MSFLIFQIKNKKQKQSPRELKILAHVTQLVEAELGL